MVRRRVFPIHTEEIQDLSARTGLEVFAGRMLRFLDPDSGGCFYSLSRDLAAWDYIHLEISGYALSFFCFLEQMGIAAYSRIADRLVSFIMDNQRPCGAFPHSTRSANGFPLRSSELYSFDTGICAGALLDYSLHRGERRSHEAAHKALDWLEGEAQLANGGFRCEFNEETGQWDSSGRALYWSSREGIYLAKMLIPFLKGRRFDAAQRLVKWLQSRQRSDGGWEASPNCRRVCTHALLYALEGLFYYLESEPDAELSRSAKKSQEWLDRQAIYYRGLPTWIPGDIARYRSDVQLQFLRLSVLTPGVSRGSLGACKERLAGLTASQGLYFLDDSQGERRLPAWPAIFEAGIHLTEPIARLI